MSKKRRSFPKQYLVQFENMSYLLDAGKLNV